MKLLYRVRSSEQNPLAQAVTQYASLPARQPNNPQPNNPQPNDRTAPNEPELQASRLGQKLDMLAPGVDFVQGMVRRGWTPNEAAGAAGNVHVESGFRPYIKSAAPG
jgi:hypothetical protein